jgi:ferric-dicitrate binding protein FerR (iron transport regulator)
MDSANRNGRPSDEALARYLATQTSAAETQRIDDWLAEHPANRTVLNELRVIWNTSPEEVNDVSALWARVRARTVNAELFPRDADAPPAVPARRTTIRPVRMAASAAALVIAVCGVFAMVQLHADSRATAPVTPREYSTGLGEHVTIQLSDGSHVTLAPQTRVRVRPEFGAASRDIELDGEAIFDVVHDARRPFRVHTTNAVTEDIGTKFDIRSYQGEPGVTVAVAEGAVSLGQRQAEGVVVHAGLVGRLDKRGQVTTRQAAQLTEYFGWANDTLAFESVRLDDVRRTLERWYDIHLQVEDSALLARTLTARMDGRNVHAMVRDIATTLDATVEWSGNIAVISRRQ